MYVDRCTSGTHHSSSSGLALTAVGCRVVFKVLTLMQKVKTVLPQSIYLSLWNPINQPGCYPLALWTMTHLLRYQHVQSLEETRPSCKQVQCFGINFHYTSEVQSHSIILNVHSRFTCFTYNTTVFSLDCIILIVVITLAHVTIIDVSEHIFCVDIWCIINVLLLNRYKDNAFHILHCTCLFHGQFCNVKVIHVLLFTSQINKQIRTKVEYPVDNQLQYSVNQNAADMYFISLGLPIFVFLPIAPQMFDRSPHSL